MRVHRNQAEIDAAAEAEQIDLSGLLCPKCGCNDTEVVKYPRGDPPRIINGQWTGKWQDSAGKAICHFCKIIFQIEYQD